MFLIFPEKEGKATVSVAVFTVRDGAFVAHRWVEFSALEAC
jgi:hypothetical protein